MSAKTAAQAQSAGPAAAPASAAPAAASPVKAGQPELGDSSRDADLMKVEAEIAKLEKQPTLEKMASAYAGIIAKMEENRRKAVQPWSPERIAELNTEYAQLKERKAQTERIVYGMSQEESQRQFATNLGIAPGQKREIPSGVRVPTDAQQQEKLAPLYKRRTELRATVEKRRAERREAERARIAVPPRSNEERIERAAAAIGIQTHRAMTDFEARLAKDPSQVVLTAPNGKLAGTGVRPVHSPTTGDPIYYLYESSGYHVIFDIYGNYQSSGELPLESPLIDPIDVILIAEGVGSLAIKGVAAGAKAVAANAPKIGARLARNARIGVAAVGIGLEDAGGVAIRGASRALVTDVAAKTTVRETSEIALKGTVREGGESIAKAGAKEVGAEAAAIPQAAAAEAAPAVAQAAAPAAAQAAAPTVATQAAAPAAANAVVSKAPADVAQALRNRYGGRLVDSNNALEGLIRRVRDPALRQHGRAASSELRDVIRILERGEVDGKAVARVELVPSSSAGRTPDLRIHFQDGTVKAWEVRSLTSAPQNRVVAKAGSGPGALARSLAEGTQDRPVSASQIGQAILSKAKNTAARPSQVAGGGTISINVSAAGVTPAQVTASVQNIATQLGAHVERIEISFLGQRASTSDPLVRETIKFLRQPNGTYVPVP